MARLCMLRATIGLVPVTSPAQAFTAVLLRW